MKVWGAEAAVAHGILPETLLALTIIPFIPARYKTLADPVTFYLKPQGLLWGLTTQIEKINSMDGLELNLLYKLKHSVCEAGLENPP